MIRYRGSCAQKHRLIDLAGAPSRFQAKGCSASCEKEEEAEEEEGEGEEEEQDEEREGEEEGFAVYSLQPVAF